MRRREANHPREAVGLHVARSVGPHVHQAPAAQGRQAVGEIGQPGQPQLVAKELGQQAIEAGPAVEAGRLRQDPRLRDLRIAHGQRAAVEAGKIALGQEDRADVV